MRAILLIVLLLLLRWPPDTANAWHRQACRSSQNRQRRLEQSLRLHTQGFQGMPRDEAWTLIEELADHSTQDRFTYYHQWWVGDVLMWDELSTMHRGAGDYRPDERRVLLRTIVYPS